MFWSCESVSDSTTFWVNELKVGSHEAVEELWRRYHRRIVDVARKRLNGHAVCRVSDEDDIAQSAFASFFRAAERGVFPDLNNSADLWRLLLLITQRKVSHRLRWHNSKRRRHASDQSVELDQIIGPAPTPEFWAIAMESFQELLGRLGDDVLCSVAIMRMQGYTGEEIASQVKCSVSTVDRKLRRIRHEWEGALRDRE
jgi:RNA polymerase sigma factor (sigma-70 family)